MNNSHVIAYTYYQLTEAARKLAGSMNNVGYRELVAKRKEAWTAESLASTAVDKHSGLTKQQTAIRNLEGEIRYYKASGDTSMAARLEEAVWRLRHRLDIAS